MAACKTNPRGNYISWDAGWTLQQASSFEMTLEDLCKQDTGKIFFWFPRVMEETALYICEALGTHLPTVKSLEEVNFLYNILDKRWPDSEKCPLYYWSDLNDKKDENVWVRGYDGHIDNETYWSPDEPNGFRYENCAFIRQNGMIDDDCAWERCAMCVFTEPQRFIMRGTCEQEIRNTYFVAYQEEFGSLVFRGYGAYHIAKDNGTWLYTDAVRDLVIASMEEHEIDYPMGRRWWKLQQEVCGIGEGERKRLLLTPCNDTQYTCDDGTCIAHHYRCDLKYDCRDRSDELECDIISFPRDYHKHLPPRIPRDDKSNVPVVVHVIIKSIGILTAEMTMTLSYELEMHWFDGRLEYFNLKRNESLNTIMVESMMRLWSPIVRLLNTDTIDKTLLEEDATAMVKRLARPLRRDDGAAGEVDVYSGEENPVSVSRKYSTTYTCNFDLTLYPFDDQHCDMHLQIVSGQVAFLEVHPNSTVVYLGSTTLNEYTVIRATGVISLNVFEETGIGDMKLIYGAPQEPSEVRVRIPLIRLYGYSILNIYIPSLILLVISYLTLFFRKSFFDSRIMATLTALLVLATLFAQASSSLPMTSYFKMVDIWLLFCVVMTFLIIIFHLLIDNFLSREQRQPTKVTPIAFEKEKFFGSRVFKWVPDLAVDKLELTAKVTVCVIDVVFIIVYVACIL
ncbi:glutamate-gated chloride channel subunit beta-like [Macrobrachium nipponense]|uniref:glutamate-gated chloride channel subunit beta-like n=1 Tax=Macrobrachium nipponense TaxID=159736 RepID=UPI0030C8AD70